MKRYMKKIATGLLAVTVFSALAGYAYAANTTFNSFSVTTMPGSYYSVDSARAKSNSSAAVIKINTSSPGSTENVRVMGCDRLGVNAVNSTMYNSQVVDHVVCGENTYYGIRNTVREKGKYYAYLSVSPTSGSGVVSGDWAPDSVQSFASPSAP